MTVELLSSTPNPESNIARCARICYDSTPKDLEAERKFIRGLVKSGHTSTIEHASASFLIKDVSRALTHELVRHRLFSFSQRSQRYVNESKPNFVVPDVLLDDNRANPKMENAKDFYYTVMDFAWKAYRQLINEYGLKPEDARFVLPNACCTTISVSGNFREWRNFLILRLSPRAQWEIRKLANIILDKLIELAPSVFEDLKENSQLSESKAV